MTTSTETPENISTSPNSELRDEKPAVAELENPIATSPDEEIQISKDLDRLISKKFDRHIVPWLFGLWLLAFIDRSNIGNAKIDGLAADLGILTGTKFNIALAIFYVPYICVDSISISQSSLDHLSITLTVIQSPQTGLSNA